ncbi:hypothetical protein GGS24DRAFT_497328 [Hypoxylon argillaceum]|nr:hypothetical protein GGS24DRAFT_497328 [Hypoxylon argillaceum]
MTPADEDELSPNGYIDNDIADDQSPTWCEPVWKGDGIIDPVSSIHTSSDLVMVANYSISNSDHSDSHLPFRDPIWGTWSMQRSPHDWPQTSTAPAMSPQVDGTSPIVLEDGLSHAVQTPSWEYPHSWAVPTPQGWTAEEADAPDPTRRASTRARQGSAVVPSEEHGDNAAGSSSTNGPSTAEHDSSDSSGGTSPVDRYQYVNVFINSEDAPWSPEFPYRRRHC